MARAEQIEAGSIRPALLAAASNDESLATAVSEKAAMRNTLWSFVATAAFGLAVVLPLKGSGGCVDFFTAFLVEKSLSVDNLFVFLMIFESFKVPEEYTQRVLTWGILSALVLRAVMIGTGVAAIQRFRPMLLVFSVILVASAVKMIREHGSEEEGDFSDSAVMWLARKMFDATDSYDGDNFYTVVDGVRRATPLLVVLACVELSDVIFAVDSIPAVVGITADPLVVYSSNVFALLALRSLYSLLAKSVQALPYLKDAVALILLFIGGKMCAEFFHLHMHKAVSPLVIVGLLAAGTIASLHHNRRHKVDPPAAAASTAAVAAAWLPGVLVAAAVPPLEPAAAERDFEPPAVAVA